MEFHIARNVPSAGFNTLGKLTNHNRLLRLSQHHISKAFPGAQHHPAARLACQAILDLAVEAAVGEDHRPPEVLSLHVQAWVRVDRSSTSV